MDGALLPTPMPAFDVGTVLAQVEALYGIQASAAEPLSSERDQLLLLASALPTPVVLKISNRAERPGTLDMENRALRHLAAVAPDLPVPRLVPTRAGADLGSIADGEGRAHLVRALTVVPGRHVEGRTIGTGLSERLGAVSARGSRGLQGFFPPT